MKNLTNIDFTISVGILFIALVAGCSKQDAEAKKVNVVAMTEALKSGDKEARVNACTELAKAGSLAAPAVPALVPVLKDPDPLVRQLAAYALYQIGPKASAAVPALKELLNDQNPDVATTALR